MKYIKVYFKFRERQEELDMQIEAVKIQIKDAQTMADKKGNCDNSETVRQAVEIENQKIELCQTIQNLNRALGLINERVKKQYKVKFDWCV